MSERGDDNKKTFLLCPPHKGFQAGLIFAYCCRLARKTSPVSAREKVEDRYLSS